MLEGLNSSQEQNKAEVRGLIFTVINQLRVIQLRSVTPQAGGRNLLAQSLTSLLDANFSQLINHPGLSKSQQETIQSLQEALKANITNGEEIKIQTVLDQFNVIKEQL